MGYIEKNLISGEKILYRTRLHSVAVLFPLLVGVVVALGGFYCLYASMAQRQNATEDAKLWAGAGLALIVLGARPRFSIGRSFSRLILDEGGKRGNGF